MEICYSFIHSFINTHKAAEKKTQKNNKKQHIKNNMLETVNIIDFFSYPLNIVWPSPYVTNIF